jgi:uracil phosphoribosyltransferase
MAEDSRPEPGPGSSPAPRAPRTKQHTQHYPHLHVQPEDPYLLHLHAHLRNKSTTREHFIVHADTLLVTTIQYALGFLPSRPVTVTTPTGVPFAGCQYYYPLVAVSILRDAQCMEPALRRVLPDIAIGKILIRRDESSPDKSAKLYYSKLPTGIADSQVLMLDPMLATATSSKMAIQFLLEAGVKQHNILFVNLVSSPQGLRALFEAYPDVHVATSMIDEGLNQHKYIVPGLGDFVSACLRHSAFQSPLLSD